MNRLPARLLVVAASLPPESTGGAVVLGRMLRDVDPRDYRLVSFDPPMAPGADEPLPATTYRICRPWRHEIAADSQYTLSSMRTLRSTTIEAARRARDIVRLVASNRCEGLLVTTGSAPDLLAGAIVARAQRLPFIVWMYDHWRHQNKALLGQTGVGLVMERAIVRSAQAVIVSTERLRDVLRREHGIEAVVIQHPHDRDVDDEREPPGPWPANPDAPTIVYTGQVYPAQLDAVARLVDALENPALSQWQLHIHGSVTPLPGYVRQNRVVTHEASDASSIREIQRLADILFLPLAFASPYPELIATALPTKTIEYLAAGRPILVHAPADSYLAHFTRRHGFAELVDQPAPELIADAILRLSGDAALRQSRVERAGALLPRFSKRDAWERFRALLGEVLDSD